jgi:hypothetical protein
MLDKKVMCPRCKSPVSIYLDACDRCNTAIEEGKSKNWMEKTPATEENNQLFISWAVPNGTIKMQYNVSTLDNSDRIDNESWGNILMWSYLWALEQLKAKNIGTLPTIAQVTEQAELTMKTATIDSHFGIFLSEQLGPSKTHLAIKWLRAFFFLFPSSKILGN